MREVELTKRTNHLQPLPQASDATTASGLDRVVSSCFAARSNSYKRGDVFFVVPWRRVGAWERSCKASLSVNSSGRRSNANLLPMRSP